MHVNLEKLLEARLTRTLPVEYRSSREVLARERKEVDRMVAESYSSGRKHIYGFTTFLGQLDRVPARKDQQASILDAHLIGRQRELPGELVDIITLVKICQLSHGGSGVSVRTYDAVCNSAFSGRPAFGAFWDSYGSGDVVPAAWWIVNVLGEAAAEEFAAGDLIALLNGTFISTGVAAASLIDLVELGGDLLTRVAGRCLPPVRDSGHPLIRALRRERARDVNGVQLPVSRRDIAPVVDAFTSAIAGLGTAVERRLSKPSSNPLFVREDGVLSPHSQSGFLDVTLTMSLSAAATGLGFAAAAMQRLTEYSAKEGLVSNSSRVRLIQPPKIAQAILQEVLRLNFTSTLVNIVESDGVEDLADGSLSAARNLRHMVARVHELLSMDDLVVRQDHREDGISRNAVVHTLLDIAKGRIPPTGA